MTTIQIIEFLKQENEPVRTVHIARFLYGKEGKPRMVNPLLYQMQRDGLVVKSCEPGGTRPRWEVASDFEVVSRASDGNRKRIRNEDFECRKRVRERDDEDLGSRKRRRHYEEPQQRTSMWLFVLFVLFAAFSTAVVVSTDPSSVDYVKAQYRFVQCWAIQTCT